MSRAAWAESKGLVRPRKLPLMVEFSPSPLSWVGMLPFVDGLLNVLLFSFDSMRSSNYSAFPGRGHRGPRGSGSRIDTWGLGAKAE